MPNITWEKDYGYTDNRVCVEIERKGMNGGYKASILFIESDVRYSSYQNSKKEAKQWLEDQINNLLINEYEYEEGNYNYA